MKIIPLNTKILIKLEETAAKTASGLFIPQTAQEKTQIGTVEAVGTGNNEVKIEVKKGDKVMFEKYAGTSVKVENLDFLIVDMKDIIAIVE